MNERDNFGPHPTHCCAEHGCKYGNDECPVVGGDAAQVYPCEECDESEEATQPRIGREHIGPTAEEFMAAHPEVDWSTHEVLYRIVNAGSIVKDGKMITCIDRWHKTPDYEALYAELRRVDELEKYIPFHTEDKIDMIGIKPAFFSELITARAKLWALESAGVDNWEGFDEAMSEPLGDEWAKELMRGDR